MQRTTCAAFVLTVVLANSGLVCAQNWHTELAPGWNSVVTRDYGWTGADGIFTVPLDGNEQFGAHHTNNTLVIFSDTFIGEVDNNGNRLNTHMINNTLAWWPPDGPHPITSEFYYKGTFNNPQSMFVPDTPNAPPGTWYWPSDGIALEDAVYFIVWRMRTPMGGGFALDGTAMVRMPYHDRPPFNDYQQYDLPFHLPENGDRGTRRFSIGIMPNTERAGAYFPDGYIYIYGAEDAWLDKHMLVARVPEEHFPIPSAWRFYAGQGQWSDDMNDAVRVTNRVSHEMSVTPLPDGRYILVFQVGTIGRELAFRLAPTPWGPWGDYHVFYTVPEPDIWPDLPITTYNAKAHPHLSEPGELLVSYNINCSDFWAHFSNADIYHPRFVKLILDQGILNNPGAEIGSQITLTPAPVIAPNPFNASAVLNFDLPMTADVNIAVYDIMGRLVETLHRGELSAGLQTVSLNANLFSSGTYFLQIDGADNIPTQKFTVVK